MYQFIDDDVYINKKEAVKTMIEEYPQAVNFLIFYYEEVEAIGIKGRKELPPLGILYFAGALKELGINVKVIPFTDKFDFSNVEGPVDFIGYSITSSLVYPHYRKLCQEMERIYTKAVKIAGNMHVTLFPEEVLEDLELDAVMCGESEYSILILLENYILGKKKIFKNVPGAYARGYICDFSELRVRVKNVSLLPHPYRKALPDDYILLSDRIKVKGCELTKVLTFVTSRGCPFHCYFCANMNNGSIRFRSRKDMDDEVKEMLTLYPEMTGVLIMDEMATLTLEHVKNWTSVMKKYHLQYVISTRGDALTDEIIAYLADSGCQEIKFGLETGAPELLKAMNKKLNLETFQKAIRATKKAGINNKVFLMHGFPGENFNTTQKTIHLLEQNKDYIDRAVLYQFTPLPGSYVYEHPGVFGLLDHSFNTSSYTIYQNMTHFWGSAEDHDMLVTEFNHLKRYVDATFRR